MILAISADGKNLKSNVANYFGRCPYIIIYNTVKKKYKIIHNKFAANKKYAGVYAANLIENKDIDIALADHIGPKALAALNKEDICVSVGIKGSIEYVVNHLIENYILGRYKLTKTPNVKDHFGFN